MKRHLVLPDRGVLFVNTDVHGNLDDFLRMESIWRAEPDAHWVILGDVVHAPDDEARREKPELYDYDDGSLAIVERILHLQGTGRVHFVLGNHDHAHVGGKVTRKFHTDEVQALESKLDDEGRAKLRELFVPALLAVAAPCGLLLTHGSPARSLERLSDLDDVPLERTAMKYAHMAMLRPLLTAYGQPDDESREMLANVSRNAGLDLRVVVHGHDRDERGFFKEGMTQLCPCIFGAPRDAKRYVRVDLAARYDDVQALRDGIEILHLYG